MKYRLDYCGVKDFATKKEMDKFIKKETYLIRQCFKYRKGRYEALQQKPFPYGKFISLGDE